MRSRISVSFKVEPYFLKPAFSSSNVIAPLLSVSIALNISLKPAISSSDKLSAITYWPNKQRLKCLLCTIPILTPHHQKKKNMMSFFKVNHQTAYRTSWSLTHACMSCFLGCHDKVATARGCVRINNLVYICIYRKENIFLTDKAQVKR